jgi:ABC-type arginine/histidine transport system permease subunit
MMTVTQLYARGLGTTLLLLALSCAISHLAAVPLAVAVARRNSRARIRVRLRGTRSSCSCSSSLVCGTAIREDRSGRCSRALRLRGPRVRDERRVPAALLGTRSWRDTELRRARFGMTDLQVLTRITLPSAFRRSLPAYANKVVLMLHATAIAGSITVLDLTAAARTAGSRTYAVLESYLAAAVLYAAVVATLTLLFRRAERRWMLA